MPHPLTGKVAIVTGAGHGTGATIARALAAAGARVAVNDINPDRAESVAATIQNAGGEALALDADVSNKFHCVKLIEATRARWAQLDILVNSAHVVPQSTILKMDEWDWNRCLDVNLKGVFFMSQLAGRVMADENHERGGYIVNIASAAGLELPWEQRAAYGASQAGVAGFARECAREYAAYGIRVNTVLRGLPTPEPAPDLRREEREAVAALVVTLCSRPGRFASGAVIPAAEGLAR
ncbi:MAG: SDR family NAD(P)-dependent oxidoreductase [Anaerolineae bacterium]|nr:SDR family NAD(P)-dependent oxidoreductase [Anaerolineae bacterium]